MSRRRKDDLGPAFEFDGSWRRSLDRRDPVVEPRWRWWAELVVLLAIGALVAAALVVIAPVVR